MRWIGEAEMWFSQNPYHWLSDPQMRSTNEKNVTIDLCNRSVQYHTVLVTVAL